MGLITLVVVIVVVLAIIGLGWNVFISGVYKGAQKIMGNSTFIKNITKRAQQLAGGLTTSGSGGRIPARHEIFPSTNM